MTVKSYLLTLPERLVRSTLGLGAGVAREVGEIALPAALRRQLYQNLVDTTLRFLIEQVGEVDGVYASADALPDNFLVRRTAGNAIEVMGIVAFRASPVWVLAAMADLCGMGRYLTPEIADALKAQGPVDKDAHFTSVDQMLDGLERTSCDGGHRQHTAARRGGLEEWNVIRQRRACSPPVPLTRDNRSNVGGAESRSGAPRSVSLRNLVGDCTLGGEEVSRSHAMALQFHTYRRHANGSGPRRGRARLLHRR